MRLVAIRVSQVGYAAISAKLIACFEGFQETILGHRFREVGILERKQGIAIDARPVGDAERVDILKLCNHPVSQG